MTVITACQQEAADALLGLVGPCRLRFCPYRPTAKQEAFVRLRNLEVLWGGGVGGGKTIGLAMAALMYADVPGYHALILRPTLAELMLPGGLMDVLAEWLQGRKAAWSTDRNAWLFPGPGRAGAGGASVGFGYLDGPIDVDRYAGLSYSFLGFDELVRFDEQPYVRMLRVLRQPADRAGMPAASDGTTLADVPVRVRSTSNPGGPHRGWVKTRFVDPTTRRQQAIYLPSTLDDNPHLDRASYLQTLAELPSALRQRLIRGDWDVGDQGELFQYDWFQIIDRAELPETSEAVRYWDLASTERSSAAPDPDYTVGVKLEKDASGTFYVTDIARARLAPGAVEQLVADTASTDGRFVPIVIEQEPGASGQAVIDHYTRDTLSGYNVSGDRPTGPKLSRASLVAAACENGLVKLVRGRNLREFLDELCSFPHARHDDCVDALSGAYLAIADTGKRYRPSSAHRIMIEGIQRRRRLY